MFGFYTLNVTVYADDKCHAVIFRKNFWFKKNAEAFADSIESAGLEINLPKEKLNNHKFHTLVTVSDRKNKNYYYIRVDTEIKGTDDE